MVTTFRLDGNNTEESILYSIIEYHERDIKVSIRSFFHQGMPVLLLSLIGVDASITIKDYL